MAEEGAVNVDYSVGDWQKIWKENESSGRKSRPVSEQLVRHVKELLPGGPDAILLPLCGQTADLRWLYDRGHTVVGLDAVDTPIQAFVKNNKDLQFERKMTKVGTPVYESRDGRLALHVCSAVDSFVRTLGPFDAVYDYGGYTAIQQGDRQAYVSTILATLKPNYRYLLEFCHDLSKDCVGGPCSISFQTVKREFGPNKQMRFLETVDSSDEWGCQSFFDTFVLFTPSHK